MKSASLHTRLCEQVPLDLLVCFLRGYAYRKDWAETVYVELSEALEWRGRAAADSVPDSSLRWTPRRELSRTPLWEPSS